MSLQQEVIEASVCHIQWYQCRKGWLRIAKTIVALRVDCLLMGHGMVRVSLG